ncbi:hypothetical protein DFA_06340 [Cavenderia fasciculata]|uniref:Uncharacterized protein n=1 Tax=Cavenderia fasciculata TaxID=261658 RepID=F4PKR9_CACFS|nr:uncharacterized protein DFA_06340 [Cavenderia fasciculata]EGG24193.1 hypothetical protein DFA_06340 [Cavenderia fasciculata]|eukprot:XP_004362044.1 hypothetical protein DFA_06340 [Cavenderia fasciculata]
MGISRTTIFKLAPKYKKFYNSKDERHFLSSFERLLIGVYHIRQFTTDILGEFIFSISETTYRNVRSNVLDFLSSSFNYIRMEKDLIDSESVLINNTIFVGAIDGVEFRTNCPTDMIWDTKFYSTKKKQHSITYLFIVSMHSKFVDAVLFLRNLEEKVLRLV